MKHLRPAPSSPAPSLDSASRFRGGWAPRAATWVALLGLVGAACATGEERLEVRELVKRGDYDAALALGEKRVADDPDDAKRQEELRLAKLAVELEAGRRAALAGRLEEALEAFDRALEADPDSQTAQRWRTKTLGELAERQQLRAKDAEASGRLEEAFLSYLEADRLFPSDTTARAGASRILLLMNHRDGLGDVYYLEGLRALREYSLPEAEQKFGGANRQRPGDPRIEDKQAEVRLLLADERTRIGEELESEGLFRAARNEYRLALLHAEEFEAALAGLERCGPEVAVLDLLDEAERLVQRRDFEQASVRVERAARLTTQQTETVESARTKLQESRRKDLYQRARERENDFRYEEAIALYSELIDEAGFYDDAIARRETLEGYIETAERLYREAAAAPDAAKRRDLLRQIQLFWPDYRDVRRQLEL